MPDYIPEIPDPKKISIVDLSFYQNDKYTPWAVDFVKMKVNGIRGVLIRAGQNLWIDRDFKMNWILAKNAGLPRGSYWFYDSRVRPERQVELWAEALGGDLGELRLWADFEDRYGGEFGGWRNWYSFLECIKVEIPEAKVGVYTAYYYWKENMALASLAQQNYFARYPLWVAGYKTDKPLIPPPFKDYMFWQWTDNGDGYFYGAESAELDMNYFRYGEAEWLNVLGDSYIPPIPGSMHPLIEQVSLILSDKTNLTMKKE